MNPLSDSETDEIYKRLNQAYWLQRNVVSRSNRKVVGSLLTWLKKLLIRVLYPPLAFIFETQNEFNANVVRILNKTRESLQFVSQQLQQKLEGMNDQLAKMHQHTISAERKLLELNNFRYMETKEAYQELLELNRLRSVEAKEMDQKLQTLNHDRYVEIKTLEHYLHSELQWLKGELMNVAYTYVHLEKEIEDLQHAARRQLAEIVGNVDHQFTAEMDKKIKDLAEEMDVLHRDMIRQIAVAEEHSNVIARERLLPQLASVQEQVAVLQDQLSLVTETLNSLKNALFQHLSVNAGEAVSAIDPDNGGEDTAN